MWESHSGTIHISMTSVNLVGFFMQPIGLQSFNPLVLFSVRTRTSYLWMVPVVNETESYRAPTCLPACTFLWRTSSRSPHSTEKRFLTALTPLALFCTYYYHCTHPMPRASKEEGESDDEDKRARSFLRLLARSVSDPAIFRHCRRKPLIVPPKDGARFRDSAWRILLDLLQQLIHS